MTEELWQLYDEQGNALAGQGKDRHDIFGRGLLHGAAHVWIWRKTNGSVEILLQRRAASKQTWPNRYDISAAGHIDLGEQPLTAALREAKEEIGLDINKSQLRLFGVHRTYMVAESGEIENEFRWLYLFELHDDQEFSLQKSEVDSLVWKPIDTFRAEYATKQYVPHENHYYQAVISAVELFSGKR